MFAKPLKLFNFFNKSLDFLKCLLNVPYRVCVGNAGISLSALTKGGAGNYGAFFLLKKSLAELLRGKTKSTDVRVNIECSTSVLLRAAVTR